MWTSHSHCHPTRDGHPHSGDSQAVTPPPEPQFPLWKVPPAHTVFVVKPRIRDGGVGSSQPLSVVQHIDQAKGDDTHHVRAE